MHTPVVGHPDGVDVDRIRRARDVLRSHDYADGPIAELLHFDGPAPLSAKTIPVMVRRTSGGSALETLVRLFIVGIAVDRAAVEAALAPMTVDDWVSLGLLAPGGADGSVLGAVQLRCYQDLVVAFDFTDRPWAHLARDYVMGISVTTLTLAGLTVRRPCRAALDLGTGSGFQALLAAGHSEQAVAVDRNPRAVGITRFNAAINGIDNLTALEGDLFEPVGRRRFDLIVSNPPFVISPESSHWFLHSGMQGDDMCRRIAARAGAHLEEGGLCQYLANWVIPEDGSWRERLAGWFDGTGCDALVLERGRRQPDEYAASWIEADAEGLESLTESLDRWLSYYADAGIAGMGTGLITLRRRATGPNWVKISESPDNMTFPCGDEVERTLAARDFLEGTDDAGFLDVSLRLSPDVRLLREAAARDGRWDTTAAHLRRTVGFQYSGSIDGFGAEVVLHCDGTRTVRQVLTELAAGLGVEPEAAFTGGVQLMRELVERGFLLAPGSEAPSV
ncbi:MAG TPA: methyltransferase [Acidimicrobiales bacterium]|nr:methyltransferase [Acidimicrobiales bacterium]